jgi:PAS domain S-box-containing protein
MISKDAPIQRKLMAVMLLTTSVALVMSCLGFISYEIFTIRQNMARALDTRAEILAASLTLTPAFQSQTDATAVLRTLQTDPRMVSACFYDSTGRIFARFPANMPATWFPASPGQRGHQFGTSFLSAFCPVVKDGRTLGTVYLKSNLSALTDRFSGYAALTLIVFVSSLLAAYLLSKILGRQISRPVQSLAATAKAISEQRDYSVRATKHGDDELGLLTDAFNQMLTRIQEQNQVLQRFAAIIEFSDDAIISKTLDGIITSWNPGAEKLFGYPAREAVGQPMLTFIPPERAREEAAILARIARGESVEHFETVRIRKDGKRADVSVTISPVKDSHGKVTGVSTVARDISERKQAEQRLAASLKEVTDLKAGLEQRVARRTAELETANKELEAFSYSVSHDLRAPLRAINGFAGIVLEDFGPQLPEAGRGYLQRIRNGGRRMGELIDDLLAFSRLSRQPVNRQLVDSARIVQEALDELKPQREGRQIELRTGVLSPCLADSTLMKQVWVNLLSNALKYSRDRQPAMVEVGCLRENNGTIFFVRDNGVGFDMQYVDKLFGVFQRLHRSDEFEGTGVGLAIVQRIVHRHGGRVWAEAQVDQGAVFYFTLEGENKT